MLLVKQDCFLDLQKWLIIVVCLFMVACNTGNRELLPSPAGSSDNNHGTIDILVSRISDDTLALINYLTLAQSTGDSYAEMATYNRLGLYHLHNYTFAEAIRYHKLFLDAAVSSGNKRMEMKALNALANDYEQRSDVNESTEYYYKALSLWNKMEDQQDETVQAEKAVTLFGLGRIYLTMGQPDEAIGYLRESYEIDNLNKNINGKAGSLLYIGACLEHSMRYDSAAHYFNRSLAHYIEANSVSGIGICFERIGNLYMMEGDDESATVYLESAYNTLRPTSDKLNWLHICLSIGKLHIKKSDFAVAGSYLREGLKVAHELDLPNYLERVYELLSELYKKEGNTAAALENHSISDKYGNAFRNAQSSHRIMKHKINYEKELNREEIKVLTEQHKQIEKRKQQTIYTILLVVIGLIVFIIVLIQNYKLRIRKDKSTLELEKLKSNFYINLSHEFKTPVSIIIGLVERLKKKTDGISSENNLIDLEILSRQAENLYLLIDEIATIANVQENERSIKPVNGDVIVFLQQLYHSFKVLAETKKIDYIFHSNVSELNMDYVPEYLRIILNNLLSNAMKHCSEKDTVTVEIHSHPDDRHCTIEVSDTGVGIQEKDLPYIFDLFYRGTNDRFKQNGSGIGLSFAKQLVEKLNGTITVQSDPHSLTVFSVTIPITNENSVQAENSITIHQQPQYDSTGMPDRAQTAQMPQRKENPFILVVEDNQDMSYYLLSILRDTYYIVTASDGKEALLIANERIPDLIISDVMMPLMNGFEFCKEVKKSQAISHIPVILLTVNNAKEQRVEGFKCGADAFISKPIYEDELMAVISQLLSTRRQIRDKYAQTAMNLEKNGDNHEIRNDAGFTFLQRVTDIIYKEIDNSDNLIEQLSSEVCLSSSQLNRKIKALTGLTTSNYILKVRLNKAKKQLVRSQKPIGEIALECGFHDFAYFSRSFRKEFGKTPTSFQRLPHPTN